VAGLLDHFDWALIEDCYDQAFCDTFSPFITALKPVFMAEYTDVGTTTAGFCPTARTLSFSGLLKHRNLDAWRQTCP
jgi:hypothetical protein